MANNAEDMNDGLMLAVEAGLAEWRATTISADGFPEDLTFMASSDLSAVDVIYYARVSEVNTSLDMAFLDLGNGKAGP